MRLIDVAGELVPQSMLFSRVTLGVIMSREVSVDRNTHHIESLTAIISNF